MNNRELKFRVWDLEEIRFIEWFNPNPMISCGTGQILCYERMATGDTLTNHRYINKRLVVQQYIGLLDKKDKEIYEGDIVQFNNDFISEIIWCEEDAAFQVKRIDKPGGAFLNQNYILNFQIVGNIFETPELLKK